MTTLPNMGINLPTLGEDIGEWDDKLNAALTKVDAHDHTSGKGSPIKAAALSIDGNVVWGGFAISALGRASFSAITAPTSGSKTLFVNSSDNELYWRTNAGVNVKLTSGSSINTTLVGGWLGDYSTVGAQAAYDDAADRYTLKQQSGTWARLAVGPVRLYEFNTSETVYIGLNAPSVLASSYDVTFASTLPLTQSLVQIGASGALVYSNSLAVNENITLSGTGVVKHGNIVAAYPARGAYTSGTGTVTFGESGNAPFTRIGGGTGNARFAILGLRAGMRLLAIRFRTATANEPTVAIYTQNGQIATLRANTRTNSQPSNGIATYTLNTPYVLLGDPNTPTAITNAELATFLVTAGASDVDMYNIEVFADYP